MNNFTQLVFVSRKNSFKNFVATLGFMLTLLVSSVSFGQTSTWLGTNTPWLTAANWSPSGAPSGTAAEAYFNNTSSLAVGINMNGISVGNSSIGAIHYGTGNTSARTINNSSTAAAGTMTLNGITLNSVANTIIRNNSSATNIITNGSSKDLSIGLGNSTDNVIAIDGTGGLTINSVISGTSKKLTKAGTGAGVLTLTGINTYTGGTTVTSGEIRFNPTANLSQSGDFTLNGGALGTTGITATRTLTFANLVLTNSSVISLATATAHRITFTTAGTFTSGKTITINGWQGTAGAAGTQGRVFVGSNSSSLTTAQLSQIVFSGYPGGAILLTNGELVPSLVVLPTVTTTTVSSITTTSASSGGDVTADGGASVTARGVAFGTAANPTTGTSDGTGIGTFTSSLTGLSINTKYYYRAFATNSAGTAYGTEYNFYTLANVPGVLTVGNPQVSTLDVTVNATTQNSNPTATEYAIHETSTGLFVQANGSLGASAVWQTAATWGAKTVIGLTQNTTYIFETKARNNEVTPVETSYGATANGTTLVNLTPGWCNLRYPTSSTIDEGATFDVYASVWKSGITDSAGQGLNISAWIGYSTSNDINSGTWTWVAANYSGDIGNNDDYKATIGAGILPGTYYYVSRFQIGSGSYVYGGTNDNFWSSTSNSAVLTVNHNIVDGGQVTLAPTTTLEGNSSSATLEFYEPGLSDTGSQNTNVTIEFAYVATTDSNPAGWSGWSSAGLTYTNAGNNDKYSFTLPSNLALGTYYVAARAKKTGSTEWQYFGSAWTTWSNSAALIVDHNLVNWCNIQAPTSGAIVEGGTYNVYAQVYDPGATTNSGQAAGITAWIGYSTTNNNPSSAGWTWVTTTFNGETGDSNNNDEYVANIATGLTPNTYYYASRFQKSGSTEFVYGGTNGTPWATSGVLTVSQAVPVVTAGAPTGTVGTAFTYNIIATSSPTSYAVSSGTLPAGLSLNTTTGAITGTPTAAGTFSVDVTATNGGGTSTPATLSFTIAKANQTITFAALAPATTATAPYALNGTATSGLTVTYASSNTAVATVSGNIITIVAPGTTIITASQVGDSNYNPATDVNQNLVVTYPVIAGWDFFGQASPASFAATTFDTNLDNTSTLSNVTRGAGATSSTGSNSFRTTGFQNNGIATTNTDFFQTTLKTDLGYSLNLSNIGANFAGTAGYATSPGVSNQFAYSLDGTTFTLIGSPTVTIGTPAPLAIDLSGVTALQNLPSGTTVTFRYYASGQTATGGWGFFSLASGTNGLAFNGTIVCVDPVAYTVTGGGSLCAGATGVAVGLSNSQKGISYQLKRDGTNVGGLVAGTGAALAFGNQTVAGTYTVEATNVACSLNLTMSGNAVVIVNPKPTLATITATPACENTPSSVTMTGLLPNTAGSFTYSIQGVPQGSVSGTSDSSGNFTFSTQNLPLAANGFIVSITSGTVSATGCTTTFSGKTVTVVVNANLPASVSVASVPSGAICSGTSVTFTATPTNGGAAPTYQWKVNNVAVSGANSSTFATNTLVNGDVVTVEMTSNAPCATGSPATSTGITMTVNANEWTGGTGDWNVATNWSCGVVPSITTPVVINTGVVTIPADAQAKSLTMTGTSTLLVVGGNDLTVADAIDVSGITNSATLGSGITVESNANLLQNGTTNTNVGTTVNIKRNSSALYRLDYTLWSAPTSGTQTLAGFSPATAANRYYTYNEGTNAYVGNNGTGTFTTGKGYLIRMPNNWVPAPGTPASWLGTFKGKPNNGDLTYAMDLTTDGYNAVGNPYPSAINIDEFFNDNPNIDGTMWLWRKTNDQNNTVSYTTCSGAGIAPGGNAHTYTDDSLLSVGQGFIVKANNALDHTLYFNNSMRASSNVNQFFRTNTVRDRYWLELKNDANVSFGTKLIAHMPTATNNYDSKLDGLFMNDRQTALLSVIDGKELVIQARPSFDVQDVIPLMFKTNTDGNYSVALSQLEGIFNNGQDILLRDNSTGTVHNLSTSGAYSFATETGSFANRFEIIYQSGALSNPTFSENSVVVYNNNHTIHVNSGKATMDKVTVFDIRGRVLVEKTKVNTSEIVIDGSRFANQVLVVQITSNEGTVTKKIVN